MNKTKKNNLKNSEAEDYASDVSTSGAHASDNKTLDANDLFYSSSSTNLNYSNNLNNSNSSNSSNNLNNTSNPSDLFNSNNSPSSHNSNNSHSMDNTNNSFVGFVDRDDKEYANNNMGHISNNVLDDPNIMKSDLLAVLSTAQGRRLVRRMFRACGVFDYMPVGDAALYAWHEGRRSVGLILYHQVFALGANFINQLLGEDKNNV